MDVRHLFYIAVFTLIGAFVGMCFMPAVSRGPVDAIQQLAIAVLLGAIVGALFGKWIAVIETGRPS